jgi:hypothetical protein
MQTMRIWIGQEKLRSNSSLFSSLFWVVATIDFGACEQSVTSGNNFTKTSDSPFMTFYSFRSFCLQPNRSLLSSLVEHWLRYASFSVVVTCNCYSDFFLTI